VTPIQIRWIDLDAYRHVNNTVYLRYLETGRLAFIGFLLGYGPGPEKGPDAEETDGLVIAELEIDYKRQLRFREEPIEVLTWVTHLGRSSIAVRNEIRDAETLFATSTSRSVCVDRVTGRPRPIRSHERAYLERYLEPAAVS
jgi:acyl-CoA thioester hydrolase